MQLDGGNTIIGTEFIKLEITGSSNLATEAFVNEAIVNGGGGGDADLSNYYNQTEVDNLLNAKLNINNPQDMAGTLRIGHLAGTSKIILNAIASDKDFYVNGDSQINGNMSVLSLDSTGYVRCANVIASNDIKTDIIDSSGANDLTLKRNTFDICYLKNSSLELNAGIDLVAPSQVQANTYNSFNDSSILFLRSDDEFMRFRKTEDDILVSKEIEGTDLKLSGSITTNAVNSGGDNDIVFKRNALNIMTLNTDGAEISTGYKLTTPIVSSPSGANLVLQRGGVNYMSLAGGQVQLSTNIKLTAGTLTGDTVNSEDFFC